MKVAIFGANGKIARMLTEKLVKANHEPLAIIRNPDQVEFFDKLKVKSSVTSLEKPASEIAKAVKGCDAVVFSAGAGGKGGAERTVQIDLDGAVKAMEAAEQVGIKRFIMVSAVRADDREFWYNLGLRTYYICKMYADRELKRTNLDWTILQPGQLEDGEGVRRYGGTFENNRKIFREDVAEFALHCLDNKNTIHKTIELINGDEPLEEFISKI